METTFNTLATGERDERDVLVHGRVLTTRRLGSVLFLSVDSITSFVFYPLNTNNNNNTQTPPTEALENYVDKDVFIQMGQLQGENLEFEKEEVLQVAVVKEDFNGEVRLNKDGTVDIHESLKEFSRIIAMGHTVEIVGKVERSSRGQLRVSCFWAKIVAKDRSNNKSQIMSKEDRDFQGHLPLCLFFRRGQECTKPTCTYRHEFKDERERLNAINMQMRHKQILKTEKDPSDPHPTESKKHRHKRAELFVDWLIETFKEKLNDTNKNILDIAGGRGTVSLLLLNKDFNCVLVEPRDHKFNPKKMKKDNITIKGQFTHMQCRLDDDFLASPEGQQAIEKTDIVIGMHPDEATEAIFDLALKFKKPFAVVPCCVFPSLFPRTNKAGNPVVTYFEFVDYLLEKDPGIQVGFLGFQGRTKVLYKL